MHALESMLRCIAVGPADNRQRLVLCFKLSNTKVVMRWTIKRLPMPDRVVKRLNAWGKAFGKGSLKFLNQSQESYEWDNEELNVSEQKVEPEMVNPHPSIPAEFPGVRLE